MTRTDWQSEPARPRREPLDWLTRLWLGDLLIIAVIVACTAVVVWAILNVVRPLVLPPYCY